MKLRFYKKSIPSMWAVIESHPTGPKWRVVECYNPMYVGWEYDDMNEFIKIHVDFVEDTSYRLGFKDQSIMEQLKPITQCNHDFKSYVGIKEMFDYCIKCDMKKAS